MGKSSKAAKVSPAKPSKDAVKATKKSKKEVVVVKKADTSSDDSSSEDEKPAPKAAAKANGKAPTKKAASSDESSESSSEDEKPKAVQVATKAKAAAPADSSDSSDDDEPAPVKTAAPTPKKADKKADKKSKKAAPVVALPKKAESSDSSEDEAPAKPAPVVAAKKADSDDSSDDSDDEKKPAAPAKAKDSESSDDSSDDSDDDKDVEMTDAPAVAATNGKRKAEDEPSAPPKKAKLDEEATGEDAPTKSIFVGRLSWNVDNDWLASEFAECGTVESATVQMDRTTGKSRGFGYVHFTEASAVDAALLLNGKEIDGRAVNIDKSQQLDKSKQRENRAKAFGDDTPSAPSPTLFVGNLSFGVTEDALWEFFGEHGSVKNVRLPTDRETGRPKGFGYVEFEDVEAAKKAYGAANGADIEGRSIRLDYSQPRDANAPRGGGRGGFDGGRGGGRGRGGFGGDRGGRGGGRGGFGDRGGRGGGRGRGAPRGGARHGTISAFEGKKTTF